ncbi:hypothetical protein C7448_108104 [Tenacibaculum gallaicum]|uniref:Uncharacterized protein n=2 Tax=Tenacibaculum gallaicum TaxID=561505 RepID=A0A3E0HIZ9_9FLAO|nr:hypothetical protein C7448_108104 [Tenacibaculum gallaicum]
MTSSNTKNIAMKNKFILLLFIITTLTNCNINQTYDSFDYGKIENDIYSNSFFNLEISIPNKWFVLDKKTTENLIEKSKDLVSGDNKNLKATIKASEINSAYLLTLFKHEPGAPVDYNPGFMVIAENLKSSPGIKNGADYLFHSRNFLKKSQIEYNNIDSEFEKVMINNQDFYRMNLDLNKGNLNIKQSYYSIIKNGFSISLILSYTTHYQKKRIRENSQFNKV